MSPIRERYIRQLAALRNELFQMGQLVEHALALAIRSIETWNNSVAAQVIDGDEEIDTAQHQIEEKIILLIATQQPVASDLRLVGSVFAIASELERIGDYARHIARKVRKAPSPPPIPALPQLTEIWTAAQGMLRRSLEAFLHQDVELARSLSQDDQRIDAEEEQLRRDLIAYAREHPQHIEFTLDMIDVVHILERIADRTTNIGERVIFMATSEIQPLN